MADPNKPFQRPRGWITKFALAFRGVAVGVRCQNSFFVDIPVAIAVLSLAWFLHASRAEWCLLVLCTAIVFGAELFNSAIEQLAKAVTHEENPHIRDALDIASGAVLVVAIGAAGLSRWSSGSHSICEFARQPASSRSTRCAPHVAACRTCRKIYYGRLR